MDISSNGNNEIEIVDGITFRTNDHNKVEINYRNYNNYCNIKSIINWIDKATCIRTVNVYLWGRSVEDACKIAHALCDNKLLDNFRYNCRCFRDEKQAVEMTKIFLSNDRLSEYYMPFDIINDDDDTVQICELLKLSTNLRSMIIHFGGITNGTNYLFDAISLNSSLVRLRMGHKQIGRYIPLLFNGCVNLRELILECNGDDDVKTIANLLPSNNNLRVLNLSHNGITLKGAIAIANALCHNETLEMLLLHDNNISIDDVYEIENILMSNYTLTCVTLIDGINCCPSVTERNKLLKEKQRFVKVKPIIV